MNNNRAVETGRALSPKRHGKRPPGRAASFPDRTRLLPADPDAGSPIAAAFMLAEHDLGARLPAVFVDDHFGLGRISVFLLGVPADIAATDDISQRAGTGESQDRGSHRGANQCLVHVGFL